MSTESSTTSLWEPVSAIQQYRPHFKERWNGEYCNLQFDSSTNNDTKNKSPTPYDMLCVTDYCTFNNETYYRVVWTHWESDRSADSWFTAKDIPEHLIKQFIAVESGNIGLYMYTLLNLY